MIENKICLDETKQFAAIIGENPSSGARSPILWNAAFKKFGLSVRMHPLDVKPENVAPLIDTLRQDNRFLGGAVTMPYKINIASLVDGLDREATLIRSINCIYRDGTSLIGSNTDGAGALASISEGLNAQNNDLQGKSVMVLGIGGVGRAVSCYLAPALGREGRLVLANRNQSGLGNIVNNLKAFCQCELSLLPPPIDLIEQVDVLVNCTSVGFEGIRTSSKGFYSLSNYSPLGPITEIFRDTNSVTSMTDYSEAEMNKIKLNNQRSFELLSRFKGFLVYDVMYQPLKSVLLYQSESLGITAINGLEMNLDQAVIAFEKVLRASNITKVSVKETREHMLAVN